MANEARLGCLAIFFFKKKHTAVSVVGSSPTLGACETRQVLLVGVPCVFFFSGFSCFFAPPTDIGPSHMS